MRKTQLIWMEQVPEEWKKLKLKYYYEFQKGKNAAIYTKEYIAENEGQYPVYSGQTENDGIMGNINKFDYDIGECLFTTTVGAKVMTPKLLKGKFSLSQNCLIMKNKKRINNLFMYYMLLTMFDYEKSMIPAYMQPSLRVEDLQKYSFYAPDFIEQQKIANFLDKKVTEIDSIIEKTKETMEDYKKYKQSVIKDIVTKGLDKNVEVKNTGIEWFGNIAKNYIVLPIKKLFNIYTGATPKTDDNENWDGDIIWVTPSDFKTEDKYVSRGERKITEKGYKSCGTTLVPENSLIFSKRAPIGTVTISKNKLCTNQGCLSCVKKIKELNIEYYYYLFLSLVDEFNLFGTGTTFKEISTTNFSDFKIIYPEIEEQNKIVEYLNKKCNEIDRLIKNKQKIIEDLEKYKKSLIYEYITGKKVI